jgi:hypothetical protein
VFFQSHSSTRYQGSHQGLEVVCDEGMVWMLGALAADITIILMSLRAFVGGNWG